MKFDKSFITLSLFVSLLMVSSSSSSQEEFIEDSAETPNVDGMFGDDLEPLDDDMVERPLRSPRASSRDEQLDDDDREDSEDISPIRRSDRFTRPTRPSNSRRSFGRNSTSAEPASILNFAQDVPNPNEKLRMDFVQVDIEEVVKYFSERLRKKFIYDPSILSGKITIVSPTEVTVQEAFQAFFSAMEIRGYVVYPTGAYLKIEKVNNARKMPVPLYTETLPNDDSYVTRIINLKFLSTNDIRRAVQDLVSRTGGDVIEHSPTNTLIISDYASNIRRIIRILNILDVEGFQEQIAVIGLNYASATEVARKINDIFPTGNASTATRRTTSRRSTRSSSAASNAQEGVIQKVVADERTNSLIILGSERGIEQVQRFIKKIDVQIDGGDGQIHVYPLQNSKAEDLSQTLASLASNAKSSSPTTARTSTARGATSAATNANASSAASLFDGEIKITADPRTNSLVVQASPRDFEVLKGIIRKLDIRRRQVFIESVILESQVGGGSDFGTSVRGPLLRTDALGRQEGQTTGADKSTGAFGFGGLDSKTLAGTLGGLLGSTAITGLALGFQSGSTIAVPVPGQNGNDATTQNVPLVTAVIRMAQNNSRINVLSTPHILATANEEAVISVGEEIPQISSNQTTESGSTISNFTRIRVATELTITPQINAGDYLTLTIKQKVNDRGAEVIPNSGQIATTTREATTTAIVKDGQTIVIGGIMRDSKTESISKVPFLGDIPILGWLFKSRTSSTTKVNLLLFITPHIIRDTGDMNDVFFQKLREREGFLKNNGLKEQKGIPLSGFTPEQLDFLDEDYVKALQLQPLPNRLPEQTEADEVELPIVQPTTEMNTSDESSSFEEVSGEDEKLDLIPMLPPLGSDSYDDEAVDSNSDSSLEESIPFSPEPVSSEPDLELEPLEPEPLIDSPSNDPQEIELPTLPELEIPEN